MSGACGVACRLSWWCLMPWREFPEQKADEPRWWEDGEDQEAAVRRGPLPSVEALTDEVVGLMLEGEARTEGGWVPMLGKPGDPFTVEDTLRADWGHAHVDPIARACDGSRPGDFAGALAFSWGWPAPRPPWWARVVGWLLAAWIAVHR